MTWRTKIVLRYFQSEFEGICWTILEKFNKEQLYKYARSTQRHQKQQIWGWTITSMKLDYIRPSWNAKLLIFPMRWHFTWFMCTRSLLAKYLAAQSGSYLCKSCICYEVYYGRLDLHISYFTSSPELFKKCYLQFPTTLCTQHCVQLSFVVLQFPAKLFWSFASTLQVVQYWHVLSMQKIYIEKKNGRFNCFELICTLLHHPFTWLDLDI